MTGGTSEFRQPATTDTPVWLIAVVLLLIADGVGFVLILLPRILKTEGGAESLIKWAGAIAIYLVAWVSWFLFGMPSWILVVGGAATVLVLLMVSGSIEPATSE